MAAPLLLRRCSGCHGFGELPGLACFSEES